MDNRRWLYMAATNVWYIIEKVGIKNYEKFIHDILTVKIDSKLIDKIRITQ